MLEVREPWRVRFGGKLFGDKDHPRRNKDGSGPLD